MGKKWDYEAVELRDGDEKMSRLVEELRGQLGESATLDKNISLSLERLGFEA